MGAAGGCALLLLLSSCPRQAPPTITPSSHPIALVLEPSSTTVAPGGVVQFVATGRLSDGTITEVNPTFTATGGSIDSDGRYTAGGVVGNYLVIASASGGLSDQASVTIGTATQTQILQDRILLENQIVLTDVGGFTVDPATEAVVLMDAHSPADAPGPSPCVDDLIRRTNLSFINLKRAAGTCSSPDEIVVFSVGDPVVLDQGNAGAIWDDATGETRTVDLGGGRRTVPVALWITSRRSPQLELVETMAKDDIKVANVRYNLNRAGLRFSVVEINRVWGTTAAIEIGLYCNPAVIPHVRPGKLNVYYVPYLTTADRGVNCRDLDGDQAADPEDWAVIYVSIADDSETTLAHELGHAFGLEHTGDDPGWGGWYNPGDFTQDNLMWSGMPARTSFSLGQAFRINLEKLSMLNRMGLRPGESRQCECRFWRGRCGPDNSLNFTNFVTQSNQDGVCPRISRGW